MDLQEKTAFDVAGVVEGTPGVALSSAGPGATRPIVRGLDGDRVVVLEDGVRTGDLGSQSPDRGLPLDPLQAERVEVIQGPATLLYGPYAIGGAVNVISMGAHLAHEPPRGFRGVARGDLSFNGRGRRGGARVMAAGAGWFAWGGATMVRKDAYSSPVGLVAFSDSLMNRGEAGFGLFSDRTWFSGSVRMEENARKLPFTGEFPSDDVEEPIDYIEVVVDAVRRQLRGDFGFRDLDFAFPELEFTVRFSDFDMDERGPPASGGIPGISTHFENRSLVFRGELKRPSGRWTGTAGLWGHHRDYDAFGQDVRPPRTRQNALAAFTYNEVQATSRLALLFGARLERNAYDVENRPESAERVPSGTPAGEYEAPPVVNRDFLGASGSARGRLTLNETTILMGTASLATRSPSLEELYDFSPSIATRGFQIGNPNLNPERPFGPRVGPARTAEPLSARSASSATPSPTSSSPGSPGMRSASIRSSSSGSRTRSIGGSKSRPTWRSVPPKSWPMLPTWMRGSPRPGNTSRGSPRSAAPWNSRSPPVTTGSPRGCAGPPAWIGCTSAKPPPMGSEC